MNGRLRARLKVPSLVLAAILSQGETIDAHASVYVTTGDGVVEIDPRSNTVVSRIELGASDGIALSPEGDRLYVGSADPDSNLRMSVVDTSSREVMATIAMPGLTKAIAFAPHGELAYSLNGQGCRAVGDCVGINALSVVDTRSNGVVKVMPLGHRCCVGPTDIAIFPDGSLVFIVVDSGLVVLDGTTHEIRHQQALPCCVHAITLTPDARAAYLVGWEFIGFLDVIDPLAFLNESRHIAYRAAARAVREVTFLAPLSKVAFVADGATYYAIAEECTRGDLGEQCSGRVLAGFDSATHAPESAVPVGETASMPVVTPDGRDAYVVDSFAESVSRFDLGTSALVASIAVAPFPRRLVAGANPPPPSEAGSSDEGCAIAGTARSPTIALEVLLGGVCLLCLRGISLGTRATRWARGLLRHGRRSRFIMRHWEWGPRVPMHRKDA